MFLAIFSLALDRGGRTVGDLPFLRVPGAGPGDDGDRPERLRQHLVLDRDRKIQGNIVDYLMPPLRPGELMFGLVIGGITRGVVVALAVCARDAAVRAAGRRCIRC